MAKYRLTQKADADLENLYRYGLETFGFERADRYFDSILERFAQIAHYPLQFQKSEHREGYRRSVHVSHVIYYRLIDSDMVEIVRILQGQDPRFEL